MLATWLGAATWLGTALLVPGVALGTAVSFGAPPAAPVRALASPPPPPLAPSPATATPAHFAPVLSADTDVLLLPAERAPAPRPVVQAATRTTATAAAVAAVALDPAAMRRALPSLVRADVVATRPGPRRDAWPDRLIAWELEIPLFNLKGRAWLRQRDNTVELALVDGAFAPGLTRIRLAPSGSGDTVVTCELQVNVQTSNFIFRRVARHDPWAESAMTAATAWVLLRAVVLGAESPGASPAPRPAGPMTPPAAAALEGRALAAPAFGALRTLGTVATIHRAGGGRLAWASAAVAVPGAAPTVAGQLAAGESWRAFPGWGTVTRVPAPSPPGGPVPWMRIKVDDNVALVDLDAVWSVSNALPTRATAVEGATRGAVLGWDVQPTERAGQSLAILSMHPHLDSAGFVERRLIAAEPLLEHALAVAITYVDAAAMAAALTAR